MFVFSCRGSSDYDNTHFAFDVLKTESQEILDISSSVKHLMVYM